MALNSVTVNINIVDQSLTQNSLATMMIFAPFDEADNTTILVAGKYWTADGLSSGDPLRIKFYTSLEEVAGDFRTTSTIYGMANDAFSQPNVSLVAIGRRDSSDTTVADALNAIVAESNNFYGVVSTYTDVATIEDIAEWVQANTKLYFAKSNQASLLTTEDTDIASVCKANSYDRTAIFYHADLSDHIDAAALAYGLTFPAGKTTFEDKVLTGIVADKLTTTQKVNLNNKLCNFYVTDHGQNVIKGGYTSKMGRYIDMRIFADFLDAIITDTVRLFQIRKSNAGSKIPYTNDGVAEVGNLLDVILMNEYNIGTLTDIAKFVNGQKILKKYIINLTPVENVPANEKANREYKYCNFECQYSSGIHSMTINGTVFA